MELIIGTLLQPGRFGAVVRARATKMAPGFESWLLAKGHSVSFKISLYFSFLMGKLDEVEATAKGILKEDVC